VRAEWIRTYTPAEPTTSHLVLFADDGSELVKLDQGEISLLSKAIRSEQREDVARIFDVPSSMIAHLSLGDPDEDETVDHTGAGNAGVVSEPDSPPAVVGALDDVDAVVEAPPEPKGAGRPTRVTNERLIAWLQVNPNSSVPDICRHFGCSSNGSMYARLQKLRGTSTTQDPTTKRWSALTAPAGEPVAQPPATAPAKKAPASPPRVANPDFRGPPVPPRPTHSNPSEDLTAQLVEIVETHGPLTPTSAHGCLPISVQARSSINDVSNALKQLLDDGRISRPRIGMYEAAS